VPSRANSGVRRHASSREQQHRDDRADAALHHRRDAVGDRLDSRPAASPSRCRDEHRQEARGVDGLAPARGGFTACASWLASCAAARNAGRLPTRDAGPEPGGTIRAHFEGGFFVIELHTGNTSNGNRAAIVLEESGLPYRVHKYDLFKGEQRASAEFMAIAPAGAVPVIVDPEGPGGKPIVLSQSCAILMYVAQKPQVSSRRSCDADRRVRMDDAGRQRHLRRVGFDFFQYGAAAGEVGTERQVLPGPGAQAVRQLRPPAADREYLADELSVADFALYPVYAYAGRWSTKPAICRTSRDGRADVARPGVQKGMALPFSQS
jgi:GST-like protein